MSKYLTLILILISSTSLACGVHQNTGFQMTTEPGSLDVFEQVIHARQMNAFSNMTKPDHFRLFSVKKALNQPHPSKLDFTLFEAIKGHYSEVSMDLEVSIQGRESSPLAGDLVLISELDVLDALSTGEISWKKANEMNLVKINGKPHEVDQLNDWFSNVFM